MDIYISPYTSPQWKRHHQLEAAYLKLRYIFRMAGYNELSHVRGDITNGYGVKLIHGRKVEDLKQNDNDKKVEDEYDNVSLVKY